MQPSQVQCRGPAGLAGGTASFMEKKGLKMLPLLSG